MYSQCPTTAYFYALVFACLKVEIIFPLFYGNMKNAYFVVLQKTLILCHLFFYILISKVCKEMSDSSYAQRIRTLSLMRIIFH